MKCHFRLCQEEAAPKWRDNPWGCPLCDEHEAEMDRLNGAAFKPRMREEAFLLLLDLADTMNNIRCDYEWNTDGYTAAQN